MNLASKNPQSPRSPSSVRRSWVVWPAVMGLLVLGACGDDDESGGSGAGSSSGGSTAVGGSGANGAGTGIGGSGNNMSAGGSSAGGSGGDAAGGNGMGGGAPLTCREVTAVGECEAPNTEDPCECCIAESCYSELENCCNTAGCYAIVTCVAATGCGGIDCYDEANCQEEIDASGGLFGMGVAAATPVGECAQEQCTGCADM